METVTTNLSPTTLINPRRLDKLAKKGYRHSYLKEMITGWIVHQIKELRNERSWSQSRLGEESGKPQSAIARIEDLDYGKWSISTLLEIAEAFDVAMEVKFVDWPTFLNSTDNTAPENMRVPSFSTEAFSPLNAESITGSVGSNSIKITSIDSDSNIVNFSDGCRFATNKIVLDKQDRLRLPSTKRNPFWPRAELEKENGNRIGMPQ